MRAVESLRVHAIELTHPLGQISFRCLDQQVIVIVHLTPGMAYPVEALANLTQYRQPCVSVGVGSVDILSTVTPRSDVIKTTGQLKS